MQTPVKAPRAETLRTGGENGLLPEAEARLRARPGFTAALTDFLCCAADIAERNKLGPARPEKPLVMSRKRGDAFAAVRAR
jgi:hypothetical protein